MSPDAAEAPMGLKPMGFTFNRDWRAWRTNRLCSTVGWKKGLHLIS
jgi:hypothetical protein